MSSKQHESGSHRIGFEPSASSPAPTLQGARRGYFEDSATKCLLQLSDNEVLLNSGTYGGKELGQSPIEMSFIRDGDYDQRLTPFVPQHHTYYGDQLTLHYRNGQWLPLVASITSLWSIFSEIVADALKLAESTGLSLLSYALDLVPRLCYKISSEDPPFFFQLLPFFSPSALRARWCCIARVAVLLEGYINLCTRLLHPAAEWARGVPVGIHFDSDSATSEDGKLARAYRFLSTIVLLKELFNDIVLDASEHLLDGPIGNASMLDSNRIATCWGSWSKMASMSSAAQKESCVSTSSVSSSSEEPLSRIDLRTFLNVDLSSP